MIIGGVILSFAIPFFLNRDYFPLKTNFLSFISLSEKILRIADNNKKTKNSHDQSEIAPKFSDGSNEVGVSYAPLSIF